MIFLFLSVWDIGDKYMPNRLFFVQDQYCLRKCYRLLKLWSKVDNNLLHWCTIFVNFVNLYRILIMENCVEYHQSWKSQIKMFHNMYCIGELMLNWLMCYVVMFILQATLLYDVKPTRFKDLMNTFIHSSSSIISWNAWEKKSCITVQSKW